MTNKKLTMRAAEFAETLGIGLQTLYNRRASDPDSLPAPLDIPGQKTLLWLYADVEKWLTQFSKVSQPKPRGRPSITRRP